MRPWISLLLLALVTLVLPWDGVRYARQMESALRQSERLDLRSLARTLAASLQGRAGLIYRFPAQARHPGPDTLTPVPLRATASLESYPDGWPSDRPWRRYGSRTHHFNILTGVNNRKLYVLLRVTDPHPVFDAPLSNPLDSSDAGDRVWIGFGGPQGRPHAEFLALTGPGPLVADRTVSKEYGRRAAVMDPRIVGALELRPSGYDIEFSLPLSMIGGPFGVLIDDRDHRGAAPLAYGMLNPRDLRPNGGLIVASRTLRPYLRRLLRPGLRLSVTTPSGAPLSHGFEPVVPSIPAPQPGVLTLLFRRLVVTGGNALITASAPIRGKAGQGVVARLNVTQTSDRWARLRDHTLQRMLNLTLATSTLAFLLAVTLATQMAIRALRRRRTHSVSR